jgi:alpha-tubulin suppressor-like RCC1 family protein
LKIVHTRADSTTPAIVAGAWRACGRRAVLAAAGQMHSCAILDNHSLWTWGGGGDGKLGLGDTKSRCSPELVDLAGYGALLVSAGNSHSAAVTRQLTLFTWGNNAYGQLGPGKIRGVATPQMTCLVGILQVSCGENHSMAIDLLGRLWCWGGGGAGQPGHDDRKRRLLSQEVASSSLGDLKAGRCRPLSAELALAWCMVSHKPLAEGSRWRNCPRNWCE